MQAAIRFTPVAGGRGSYAIRAAAHQAVILISVLVLVLATLSAIAAERELCGEKFASYEALEDIIKAKPGVKVLPGDDIYVSYHDPATKYIWNFATRINPAFPSVACRRIVNIAPGDSRVATNILCAAEKAACDRQAAAYVQLDRQMTDAIRRGTR